MGNITSVLVKTKTKTKTNKSRKVSINKLRKVPSNGRRFYNVETSKYFLPSDDDECDRQQLYHFYFRYVWQGNFSSPVKKVLEAGGRVLNIGCKTGNWVLDMAAEFPNSDFVGIDTAPTFPKATKRTNVTFFQASVLKGLPFDDEVFDFVYMDHAVLNFTEKEWATALSEIIRVAKINAYVELMESDFSVSNIPLSFAPLLKAKLEDHGLKGINPDIAPRLGDLLEATKKLTDIVNDIAPLSLCGLDRASTVCRVMFLQYYRASSHDLILRLGMTDEEFEGLIERGDDELKECDSYSHIYRSFGRKAGGST